VHDVQQPLRVEDDLGEDVLLGEGLFGLPTALG